jgi:tetratricopeptide (TPR) repeat protein
VRDPARLGSLLRGEQDRALGRRALRAGLLSDADLAAGPAEEALRARGVPDERIRELKAAVDREDFDVFRARRPVPPEAREALEHPDRRVAEFVLVRPLGQGGLGEVWKAWDSRLGRWVALKRAPLGTGSDSAERLAREAMAAARLSHPNIVPLHKVAEEDGRVVIVMQYVEGRTLAQARPPLRETLAVLRDVALAVHHAHLQGVVHRDLKPGNLMLGADGWPFVLDFGLAHLEEAGRAHTRDGLVAGTAAYMSPEQARGDPAMRDPKTDVYSLGATLYDLAVGRPPFSGASFAETLRRVLDEEPVAPCAANPSIPADVETVVLKAMDKDPARRYANARELADDLDRCLRDVPVAARRASAATGLWRRTRRRPALASLVAVLLLAAGAVVWNARREGEAKLKAFRDVALQTLEGLHGLRRAGANERMSFLLPGLRQAVPPDVPEAHVLLARIERALMNDERAGEHVDRALSLRPRDPPALYERIVLSSRRGRPVADELARLDASSLRPAQREVVAGLATRDPAAFEKAVALDPRLEEGWEGLARAWTAALDGKSSLADREKAQRRAEEALTRAIGYDRGFVPFWAARGAARAACARLLAATGRDPQIDFQGADDDYSQAARLSESLPVLRERALLRGDRGTWKMRLGGNPLPDFGEAEEDLHRAPDDPGCLAGRAHVARRRAEFLLMRGECPTARIDAGLKFAAQAGAAGLFERAALLALRLASGVPNRDLHECRAAFVVARRAGEAGPELLERRAFAGLHAGDLAAAERDARAALELSPPFDPARVTLAAVRRARSAKAEDPEAPLAEAAAELDRVLATNPHATDAWEESGRVELDRARIRAAKGDAGGARRHFAEAHRRLEETARLNGHRAAALRDLIRDARRGALGNP